MKHPRLRHNFAALLLLPACYSSARAQTAAPNPIPLAKLDFETPGGTLSGDAKLGSGLSGQALTLGGTGALALTQPLDTSKSFSVMAWVKLAKTTGFQTILSSDGPTNSAFFLQLRDDTHQFAFTMLPNSNELGAQAGMTAEVKPNVWYHLAGVYDAAKHTASLYVNGTVQDSVPFSLAYAADGPVRVGRAEFGGNPVDFVTGQIDEAQVFQSALSAAQIGGIVAPLLGQVPAAPVAAPAPAPLVPAALSIDASKIRARVSPLLYGLMTEEINHAFDGGLYAELIRNRSFQDDANAPVGWNLLQTGGVGTMSLDTAQPMNTARPVSLKLQMSGGVGTVSAQNEGFWGIPIHPKTRYRASFWARTDGRSDAAIRVDLYGSDGRTYLSNGVGITVSGTTWKKYEATLSTGATPASTDGRFVISLRKPGTIWLSQVSLFPPTYQNRKNGNRIDISEKMAAMAPKYLRFPGGNYLEGDTIADRFDWKKTLGPVEARPGHRGPWNYRSTDGMGLLEFLGWCDDLKMEPVLAVYAGYSLRQEHVDAGPKLQGFVQDALDEIEYLTGDKSTVWGARRIADGHPKAFNLKYVEIGNEDFFDRSNSYDARFTQFYDSIKAKYPGLQLISTVMNGGNLVKSRKPDVIDEHYYLSAREMEARADFYDKYDRNGPKIFVGEWASHTERVPWQDPQFLNAPTPDLGAALGDAAFLTGLERNSDIVVMQCYAPLLVNVNPGARQWAPNLIGYNNLTSYGAPSYWAQSMFSKRLGDVVLDSRLSGGSRLAQSVTRDSKTGQIFVKIVNSSERSQSVQMQISGAQIASTGVVTRLQGASPKATNTLADPRKVVPVTMPVSDVSGNFAFLAPAYSVSVLELKSR